MKINLAFEYFTSFAAAGAFGMYIFGERLMLDLFGGFETGARLLSAPVCASSPRNPARNAGWEIYHVLA